MADLLTVGDNVVDQYPDRGLFYPGGNAVNVAVHARRLGASSAYIGAVGTDYAGEVVLEALQEEGVDTSRTRVVEGPNAHALVRLIDGNRVFAGGALGVSVFTMDEGDLSFARSFDMVHTGECSNIEAQLPDLAAAARRLSFDFSERDWDYIEGIAPYVDVAIRSLPDSNREQALRQARRLHALGPRTVAVTIGSEGAVVLHCGEVHLGDPPAVDVVDTLGAGDAFIARLLVGLVRHDPVAEIVSAATTYATQTCASFGAFGHATALDRAERSPFPQHQDRLDVS
jgi:fructoselysine 6-kinase